MSERKQVPITVTKRAEGDTLETHPSFGLVSVGRYTCNPSQHFFGSAIAHHTGVSLSIHTAEKVRNLSNDWFHDTGELIEINMTETQWAQVLSHFNVGPGVPCTLNHVNRALASKYPDISVPKCPEVHERKQIETEFQSEMSKITDGMKSLHKLADDLLTKQSVTKGDRKQFVDIVNTLQRKIDSCMPFIVGQFNESLDGMVTEAKADVEAFTGSMLRQAGIEAIKEKLAATSRAMVDSINAAKPAVIELPKETKLLEG